MLQGLVFRSFLPNKVAVSSFPKFCPKTHSRLISTKPLASVRTSLNYQQKKEGQRVGRYIDQPDKGDLFDVNVPHEVTIHNARLQAPSPALEVNGFQMTQKETFVKDFSDNEEIARVYYPEMTDLIQRTSGAKKVVIFDHTVRKSTLTNKNALGDGDAAGSVARVHCDYTADSAPLRVKQLLEKESYTGFKLDQSEIKEHLNSRFAFINVWRSIADTPILTKPLTVCEPRSVDPKTHFIYELAFPDRIGQNYSLPYSPDHQWYYYPEMVKEECLMFKVYDKKEDGPRFVFHTAFDDPSSPDDAPARHSIEIRSIAFF